MLKKKDLTGQIIGNLKVIKELSSPYRVDKPTEKRRTRLILECECRCGKIFYPFKTNVLRGKTKQCLSCIKAGELLFKRFGNLEVISRDYSKTKEAYFGGAYFICKCDCGHIDSFKSRYLRNGKPPQVCERCRHPKKYSTEPKLTIQQSAIIRGQKKHKKKQETILNKKFHNIKVLEFSHWEQSASRRRPYYKCKCRCGNVFTMRSDAIGKTRSCGCIHKESILRGENNPRAFFTTKEVQAMREMVTSGLYTQRRISQIFKVTESLISGIILKKSYKND